MARWIRLALACALVLIGIAIGIGAERASGDDIEQRVADFWRRIDARQPTDYVSTAELGEWALNVIARDARARLTVADFRASTAAMQGGIERAGPALSAPATQQPSASVHTVTLTVTSPVGRGSSATATATTTAGSSCTITVTYASGPSSAAGLAAKNADASGAASWTWTVGSQTSLGTWPVDVACTSPAGQRATARQTFVVQ